MQIDNLERGFTYNGVQLADPNPSFTLAQVRDFYSTVYAEIVSADIEGPKQVGAKAIYTFRRAVGTKGAPTLADYIRDLAALLHVNGLDEPDADAVKRFQEDLDNGNDFPIARGQLLLDLHAKYCSKKAA